jgi:hypothetical protein
VALPPFFSSRPTQKDLTFNPPPIFLPEKDLSAYRKSETGKLRRKTDVAEREEVQKERECRKKDLSYAGLFSFSLKGT